MPDLRSALGRLIIAADEAARILEDVRHPHHGAVLRTSVREAESALREQPSRESVAKKARADAAEAGLDANATMDYIEEALAEQPPDAGEELEAERAASTNYARIGDHWKSRALKAEEAVRKVDELANEIAMEDSEGILTRQVTGYELKNILARAGFRDIARTAKEGKA